MSYKISKADVFAVDVLNRPGMLARVLEAVGNAGANLEFVIARQVSRNTSRVFLSPLMGKFQLRAAADVGLVRADGIHTLRIEGPDKAGLGAKLTRGLAAAGLNIRGLSAASIKKGSVCYVAFATTDEATLAAKVLKKVLSGKSK